MKRLTAHAISWIANPGCLLMAMLLLGVLSTTSFSHQARIGWLVTLVVLSVAATIIVVVAWVRGVMLDADLMTPVNLADRSQVLIIIVSLICLMLVASFRMHEPQPFHAFLVALLILGLVVAAITLVWKISLHMLGVGMLVAMTIAIDGFRWWPILLLIPLVGWARLRLHRHTPYQLTGGLLVGSGIALVVLRLYHLV